MEIMGYSERGVINSLFYEVFYKNNQEALKKILAMAYFPVDESISSHFIAPDYQIDKVFLEQSFSDFGDSDVVILARKGSEKEIIFIEAKVSQNKSKDIESFYNEFKKYVKKEKKDKKEYITSNLFSQLYLKQRLTDIRKKNQKETIIKGCLIIGEVGKRGIGYNTVVLNVFEEIENYANKSFYISIIPGVPIDSKDFIKEKLLSEETQKFIQNSFDQKFNWNMNEWGFLFWSEIYDKFFMSPEFPVTKKIFESNKTQILKIREKNNVRNSNERKRRMVNDKVLTINDFYNGLNDSENEYFKDFIEELRILGITCKMGQGGLNEGKGIKSFNISFKRKQDKKEKNIYDQLFRLGGGRNWRENKNEDATVYLSKSADQSETAKNDDVFNKVRNVFSELYKYKHFESRIARYPIDEWKICEIKDVFPPNKMAKLFLEAQKELNG